MGKTPNFCSSDAAVSSETRNLSALIVFLNKIIWQLSQSPRAADTCLWSWAGRVCTVALRESSFCMLAAHSGDVLSLRCFNNVFISSTWKPWQRALVCLHTLPTSRVPGCIGTCGFGHNGCLSFCFRVQHVLLTRFLFFCRCKNACPHMSVCKSSDGLHHMQWWLYPCLSFRSSLSTFCNKIILGCVETSCEGMDVQLMSLTLFRLLCDEMTCDVPI